MPSTPRHRFAYIHIDDRVGMHGVAGLPSPGLFSTTCRFDGHFGMQKFIHEKPYSIPRLCLIHHRHLFWDMVSYHAQVNTERPPFRRRALVRILQMT